MIETTNAEDVPPVLDTSETNVPDPLDPCVESYVPSSWGDCPAICFSSRAMDLSICETKTYSMRLPPGRFAVGAPTSMRTHRALIGEYSGIVIPYDCAVCYPPSGAGTTVTRCEGGVVIANPSFIPTMPNNEKPSVLDTDDTVTST